VTSAQVQVDVQAHARKQRVGAYAVCLDSASRVLLCRMSDQTRTPGTWRVAWMDPHAVAAARLSDHASYAIDLVRAAESAAASPASRSSPVG
jgi:hypothetical protein